MIEEPPLLTIRRHFERPDAATLAALAGVPTGHLTDAMNGRGALDFAIRAVEVSQASFVGTALTCDTGPSDNLAVLAAISMARPGDVIVAAADGFTGTAIIGDNLAGMARNRGVVAIVTDGLARDTDGIIEVGLPVFSRGVTPNSCVRSGPGRIGFPVVVGGVAVEAGDAVVGDRDGVVIVPRTKLGEVLAALKTIAAAEAALQARIKAGLAQLDSVDALLHSGRVRYVE
jgi:4-hydroxy-4-methyl-2-oxoglutarate aldolase